MIWNDSGGRFPRARGGRLAAEICEVPRLTIERSLHAVTKRLIPAVQRFSADISEDICDERTADFRHRLMEPIERDRNVAYLAFDSG